MLNDPYDSEWLDELRQLASAGTSDAKLYFLIDGAFKPGFYRQVIKETKVENYALLFETLPSCSEAVKDVSPFLLQYDATQHSSFEVLQQCSGHPMVSVIETTETIDELTSRMAPWCIVYSDQQRFNFRFADTRRLPDIFSALNGDQKSQITGPALKWSYIDRQGQWLNLPIEASDNAAISTWPELDDSQFAMLVSASETDEMLERISRRQHLPNELPSRLYDAISQALRISTNKGLESGPLLRWCVSCIDNLSSLSDEALAQEFLSWQENKALI